MNKYAADDEVTFYFVLSKTDKVTYIKGWTDSKAMVKAYLDFHNSKAFHVKTMTRPFSEIATILNENANDEINIATLYIRNPEGRRGHEVREMKVPVTGTEMANIRDETSTYMASRIDYEKIHNAYAYLKGKYQKALDTLLLDKVIAYNMANKHSDILSNITLDELNILVTTFPDEFEC